jgi:hypothetical protein
MFHVKQEAGPGTLAGNAGQNISHKTRRAWMKNQIIKALFFSCFMLAVFFFSSCVTVDQPPDENDISDSVLLAGYFPGTVRGEKIFDSLDEGFYYLKTNEGILRGNK